MEEGRKLKLIHRFNLICANRTCQFWFPALFSVNIYLNATLLARLRLLVLLQTQHVCLSGFLKYDFFFPQCFRRLAALHSKITGLNERHDSESPKGLVAPNLSPLTSTASGP